MPVETLYEILLTRGISVAVHSRSFLLTTISRLPLVLQSIHGEQDEQAHETHIRAELMTAGRNKGTSESCELADHARRLHASHLREQARGE